MAACVGLVQCPLWAAFIVRLACCCPSWLGLARCCGSPGCALCRYRALAALGGDRAGREQPGPPVPAVSAALRASHPATRAPGTAASTDPLPAFPPPPSPLPAATSTAMLGQHGGQQENNPGRVQHQGNCHQRRAAPAKKHPHLCTAWGLFSSCWNTFH